jgi:hypothetical protein
VDEWSGEESFAKGTNSVRFPNQLGEATFGGPQLTVTIDCAFRRFHSNGRAARWEVGLSLKGADGAITRAQFSRLLQEVADIPISITGPEKPAKPCSLADAGQQLARHYLLATSRRDPAPTTIEPWWFEAGDPRVWKFCDQPSPTGRNPKIGETVPVPEKFVPHFKARKDLRARVDNWDLGTNHTV